MLKKSATRGFEHLTTDRTQAFEGLAKNYDRVRPTYPVEVYWSIMKFLREKSCSTTRPVIIDVGCGTGLSTRSFYNALEGECSMVGVEPGNDMLQTAIEASLPKITYKKGSAEALPIDDQSVDIVSVAQAAQWFDRPVFLREAKRVLKSCGVIAIYENNRDWINNKFLEKHEEFLEEYSKGYSRYYRDFPYEQELKENFKEVETQVFFWSRKMSSGEFLDMAKTSTQVKRAIDAIGVKAVDDMILKNLKEHVGQDGKIDVPYNTKLYIGRK